MRIFLFFILLFYTTILFGQVDTLNLALLYPKAGPYKDFYKSGKIKTLGAFALVDSIECINCFDKDQNKKISRAQTRLMRVGEWKEYYENGQIKSAGTYKGIHETYSTIWLDERGEKIESEQFAAGGYREEYLKDKIWKYYNDTGQLTREEFYFNGTLANVDIYKK